jgi:hypothetical protein
MNRLKRKNVLFAAKLNVPSAEEASIHRTGDA